MSERLENGYQVKTKIHGITLQVKKYLAEGGQGTVYIVDYNGEDKALKWYKKASLGSNPNAFYDNIENNVIKKAPNADFLWPLDITEWSDGSFGYVMDLRPKGYFEITDYMLCHVKFKSYKTIIDAAMRIVSAFRILHDMGYSYQDVNDGNFFINPKTGKVLICDNDNVAPEGRETGIIGKPRYMAPEIVLGSKPNSLSDRFSMSVILYILFCLNHPLEGKRYLVPALTSSLQKKLYGSDPLFIMDPNDKSNGPDHVIHKNSLMVWPCLPDYMQKMFTDAFSKESFENPHKRATEISWLKALTRFRSDIVPCRCGNEIFTKNGDVCKCDACGKNAQIPFKFVLSSGYTIPAVKDSRFYRCQVGVCNAKDALNPVALVLEKGHTGILGIKNKSGVVWYAKTPSGVDKKVAPDEIIPLKNGITFTVYDAEVKIIEN